MENETISLLSDSSLSVYRNATDFCMLILYPANFTKFISELQTLFVASLGLSMYSVILSANSDNFTCSFPIWILYFFSCLTAVARTSIYIELKWSYSLACSWPDKKFFRRSTLQVRNWLWAHPEPLSCVFSLCSLSGEFLSNECWILSTASRASTEMVTLFLVWPSICYFFSSVCLFHTDLQILKNLWIPVINLTDY